MSNTSYLDLSQVYGSTAFIADTLRTQFRRPVEDQSRQHAAVQQPRLLLAGAVGRAQHGQRRPSARFHSVVRGGGPARQRDHRTDLAANPVHCATNNAIATTLASQDPNAYGFTSWTDEKPVSGGPEDQHRTNTRTSSIPPTCPPLLGAECDPGATPVTTRPSIRPSPPSSPLWASGSATAS